MGENGAPHLEPERLLYEAYCKGHCWAVGAWNPKGYYDEFLDRIRFAMWRDRAALGFGARAPATAAEAAPILAGWKLVPLTAPELKAVIDKALALQRTSSVHVVGNTAGQVYTRSGWNTNWSRLMGYCEKEAQARGVPFERFALRDMRPAAVTDRQEEGDDRIIDATGHADERMVRKIYDRRRQRKVRATR
ncbi:hypothetical protein [Burkholderia ubonensis]|uniref:hypothetical protein n=1 Tax=Burkholderia ubonensis TaxID=101571 RepID=UPI000A7BB1A2|nr:hypothetical protein [Burkholderia ubonensis]